MPELPEVESVARALRRHLAGRRLTGLEAPFPGVLGQPLRATRRALLGKVFTDVHRRGKYMIATFSGDDPADPHDRAHLMIHLRMTGQVFVLDGYVPDHHVHVSFDFDGLPVHYRDVRKFGRLTLVEDPVAPAALAHVGPDMLAVRWPEWRQRLGRRYAPIKAVLLDQGLASGLGNIYVDECLFLAGVRPTTPACDLDEATLREILRRAKQVLRLAITHGGTTFLNFTDFYGKPGNFRRKLRVYGRAGQPCRTCGGVLAKTTVAGRTSVYCPACQA
ncbi:MAG: bifunctional DNA-formamidopyrimidine glycosylase/DNA-(apurinic or apyrimidinic site) lyase [Candidatus Krumholzibacteriia bacterium]